MAIMPARLQPRQQGSGYEPVEDPYYYGTWGTVRFALSIAIVGALLLFFIGGYLHARRRLRRGLPPLRYHAWMLRSRRTYYPRGNVYYRPAGADPQAYGGQPGYPLDEQSPYAPAPPPPYVPPPTYQPPEGASKVRADQRFGEHREGGPSGAVREVAPQRET